MTLEVPDVAGATDATEIASVPDVPTTATAADRRTRFIVGAIDTPLGAMTAGATDRGIAFLEFSDGPRAVRHRRRIEHARGIAGTPGDDALLDVLRAQLDAFFAGRVRTIAIPLDAVGTTFEQRCWSWLRTIPFGETRTYASAAAALGTSPRAVGRANAANPIAILVPCHRLVGSAGSLVGYGGGLERKQRLLDLERRFGG